MGRKPCCSKIGLNKGAWTPIEDSVLTNFIQLHGGGKWKSLPDRAGIKRCGKSCRLRWLNYLRPDIKRGNITPDEEDLIIRLHKLLGNRWSLIAGRLPGRTDNEIKNYWNTNLGKRVRNQNATPQTTSRSKQPNPRANNVSPVQSRSASTVFTARATRCTKVISPPDPLAHAPVHVAAPLADYCPKLQRERPQPLTEPSSDENTASHDCLQYSNFFSGILDNDLGFNDAGMPDQVDILTSDDFIFSDDMFCSSVEPELDWLPQLL